MRNTCKMSYIINHSKLVSEITMEEAVAEIRSNKHQAKTLEIRRLSDAGDVEGANRVKGTLPGFTPAGTFLGRRKADCINGHTSFIVLDVDGVAPELFGEICRKLETDVHTCVRYTSPKRGVKIIVRGEPLEVADSCTQQQRVEIIREYHSRLFRSLVPYYEELIGVKIDVSGSDLPRITYLCHDPYVYHNPESVPFVVPTGDTAKRRRTPATRITVPEAENLNASMNLQSDDTTEEGNKSRKKGDKVKKSFLMLFRALEMQLGKVKNYEPGNRNNYLYSLACKCNEAGIEEESLLALMANSYPDISLDEINSIVDSAYSKTESHGIHPLSKPAIRVLYAQCYLNERYEFRFNEIKSLLEFRRKEPDAEFVLIDDRIRNSLWVELSERGSECSADQLFSILNSSFSRQYNPLKDYLGNLPPWDKKDHITLFANRVQTTCQGYWEKCIKKWLCSMVAAVIHPNVQNHTVIILDGKQSIGKTTFARSILPPVLKDYYCEDKINTENKDDMIKVYQSLIINTEEVDMMTGRELNQYKALITRSTMNIRLPYERTMKVRKRLASFMCTTNNHDILTDETGNRRFICVEAISFNNETPIDYEQLYAQIIHLLVVEKYRHWYTKEESVIINKHNEGFTQKSIEEEYIWSNLRIPRGADDVSYLTASEISEIFNKRNGIHITHASKVAIGRAMKRIGYKFLTCSGGTVKYMVHVINFEEVTLNKRIADEKEKEPDGVQQNLAL